MGVASAVFGRIKGIAINVAATKLVDKVINGSIDIKNVIPNLQEKIPDLANKIPDLNNTVTNLKSKIPNIGQNDISIQKLINGTDFANEAGLSDINMSDFMDTSELKQYGVDINPDDYIPKFDIKSLLSGNSEK